MLKWELKNHSSTQKKKKFGREEDKKLTELVSIYGEDWTKIIQFLPGRSVRQVMERWKYYLDPTINNDPWSPEEDKALLEYQNELGNKWTKMLKFFQNRTANQLKNRYLSIVRKNHSLQPNLVENEKTQTQKFISLTTTPILPPQIPSIETFVVPNSTPIELPSELFLNQNQTFLQTNQTIIPALQEIHPLRKTITKIPSIMDFLN